LGNMSPHPLTFDTGLLAGTWRTAEALFQAHRFYDDGDPAHDVALGEIREQIRRCPSPMEAKMIAKRNVARMVIQPRGAQDLSWMEEVLRLKLAQHPALRQQLLEIPADALIVEDVTARGVSESHVFWGAARINGEWIGTNQLGSMWMKIRGEIPAPETQRDMFHRHDGSAIVPASHNDNQEEKSQP
jgi:predicted NAD-dependent protein-ADP-ribosyltransferase YbiA (DUF1768 family)